MKFKIKAYNLQELGQRQNQEDSLFPALGKSTINDRLFVLCDGMGGHEKGEVASATVCETISSTILSAWHSDEALRDELFLQALSAAYDALDIKDNGEERKMGTTMTFLCLHANGATVAHIGDSRIYQLRPATKKSPARIVFRTQDHSLVNDLVKIGEITEEEAKHHPQKNVITRAMQPCQEHRAKADIAHLTDIQPGDYFYMCSDGMLEQSTDENILNIITKPNVNDEDKLEMLRQVTVENKDNHTAHLIYIDNVEGKVSVVPEEEPCSAVKGTWIIPDFSNPTNKHKLWLGLLGALLVVVAAALFFLGGKGEKPKVVKRENTNIDSSRVKTSKHERDTTKKDSVKPQTNTTKEDKQTDERKQQIDNDAKPAFTQKRDIKEFVPKKNNSPKENNSPKVEQPTKTNEKKI